MATTQSLTLTQVSQSVLTNKSIVRILWTTTQTGTSYNDYEKVGYYWVSVNGAPETKHTIYSTLPWQSTKTIVDTTIEVEHDQYGDCTVAVRTSMATGISAGTIAKSASLKLDNIPRASVITSVTNITLGNACSVTWTPKLASFWYRLTFSIADWSYTTEAIHPNQTAPYTYSQVIPVEVAEKITEGFTGGMTVTLSTYSDSIATTQVGASDSETFQVTVPEAAAPIVSMSLSPVHSLPATFDGIYIQGISKVTAVLSAVPQYNTRIVYYDMTVEGKTYGVFEDYTSEYLTNTGTITVIGHAEDKRLYGGYVVQEITVIPYANPKVQNVTAKRCDENGNLKDDGDYLKIAAKRSYYPVVSNGVQKNFCKIEYRYKIESEKRFSDWYTILDGNDLSTDEVVTAPLLDGDFLATNSYLVEVRAVDDIGTPAVVPIDVPTDKVYWHRDGKRNSLGLGKYNEKDNAVDSAWDIYMNDHKITGLPMPTDDTDAVPKAYAAPADIKMRKSLNAPGWYKIGKITGNMCAVVTFTIGGVFQYNQVMPSSVDIATHYHGVRVFTRFTTQTENQISAIGVIMEDPVVHGVYVYYNSDQVNPVDVVIHPSMGVFEPEDWIASDVGNIMTLVTSLVG